MNRIVSGYQITDTQVFKKQNAISRLGFLKARLLIRLLMLGGFIVLLSLFYIWSRVQIVQMGYELNELTIEQQNIIEDNKKLQMELSLMKAPDRIEKFAAEKLNMALPDKDRIIAISLPQ